MNTAEDLGYDLIIGEIPAGARVLDLGCGSGLLLQRLKNEKNVTGYGVELSEQSVSQCLERGVYCYQGDIDEGLSDYKDNSFDYVILSQTLQSTKRPDFVIHEVLRIGKNTIISFPNFAYYVTRVQLLCRGTMPKNRLLPYEWYETPNIHLITVKDFRVFCERRRYPVKKEMHFSVTDSGGIVVVRTLANIRAQYGFFVLDGESVTGDSPRA